MGLPLVRSLGRELWEVRSSLTQGRIARVIFCVSEGQMVLLKRVLARQISAQMEDPLPRG